MPEKNEEETYEKIIDMSNNNDYTTSNLLEHFIEKLSRNTGATMVFIIEKSEETTFNFLQISVTII